MYGGAFLFCGGVETGIGNAFRRIGRGHGGAKPKAQQPDSSRPGLSPSWVARGWRGLSGQLGVMSIMAALDQPSAVTA